MHVAEPVFRSAENPLWYLTSPEPRSVLQVVLALEFAEQILRRFAEQIHQHVEAAAMRHADDGLLDAGSAALLHQLVEQRHEAVAALERKALLADVLGVQIALQPFGRRQLPEDVLLLLGAEAMLHARRLEIILQPQPLLGIRDVREFGADGVAVDELERREDVAQLAARRNRRSAAAGEEFGLHVRVGQPEVLEIEHVRLGALLQAQGVEVGDQVAAIRVDLDQAATPPPAWRWRHRRFAAGGGRRDRTLRLRRQALARFAR